MKSALVGVVVVTAYTIATPVLGQFPNITNNEYVRVAGTMDFLGFKQDAFNEIGNIILSGQATDAVSYIGLDGGSNEGSAFVSAVAAVGQLHAKAIVVGGTSDDFISVDAHATAETADHVMFLLPFPITLRVVVPLKISGYALAQKSVNPPFAPSFAKCSAGFLGMATATKLGGEFIQNAFLGGQAVAPDDFSIDQAVPSSDEFLLVMDVRANEFFQINLQLTTLAHFEFNDNSFFQTFSGSGDSSASFEHSLVWGGIRSVSDPVTGLPIEGWSVVSASGTDYSKSFETPEPSSLVLLVVGVAGCLMRRRVAGGRA
jgi:PEP-CTERM motif